MASIIWVIVLLTGTLALGGCAGLPYGALGALGSGYGGGSGSGYGYGGTACSQPYAASGIPVPVDPGYAGGYAPQAGVYAQPAQPYYPPQAYAYNNESAYYPPATQSGQYGPPHPPWSAAEVDQRLQRQMDRIQQGLNSGQLTPEEYQRLQAEQNHIQGAMTRMQADGRLNPREVARLNQMLNRSNQDIYRLSHNSATVTPGTGTTGTTATGSTARPGTGSTGVFGNGTTAQSGNGSMAQTGRGYPGQPPRYQGNGGPMAQPRAAYSPGFQPNNRMAGPPPNMGGPRFQPRPVQPAVAPRVQPNNRVAVLPGR